MHAWRERPWPPLVQRRGRRATEESKQLCSSVKYSPPSASSVTNNPYLPLMQLPYIVLTERGHAVHASPLRFLSALCASITSAINRALHMLSNVYRRPTHPEPPSLPCRPCTGPLHRLPALLLLTVHQRVGRAASLPCNVHHHHHPHQRASCTPDPCTAACTRTTSPTTSTPFSHRPRHPSLSHPHRPCIPRNVQLSLPPLRVTCILSLSLSLYA